jgi:hypothetical protein
MYSSLQANINIFNNFLNKDKFLYIKIIISKYLLVVLRFNINLIFFFKNIINKKLDAKTKKF